ncbi:hypothetical protein ENSA5_35060 [Enhygromyxa salina]|uniref:Lipoprotein n=1 Tax=Enhygromyxa salina TaxID=215803 RepID=A0A2S9XWM9_9BACT|nr:DUF5329 family protein [Enhygromyxa salina]PRP97121.1 hypothetical protein ENSA5_35060 [Enhygromyxa salina]
MPRARALALVPVLGFTAALACRDEPPTVRHEPMRSPSAGVGAGSAASEAGPAPDEVKTGGEAEAGAASKLADRPPADPAIDKALDLISASGLRFVDQADGEDSDPSEYTAEQFASMLRTKWEWIGYDLIELEPWLDEIAARSFKSNLPYLVVLADGSTVELSAWLAQQLAESESP